MNTLVFQGKWFPNNTGGDSPDEPSKALRIVNIANTSGKVKVSGGNASIYGEPTRSADINKLQFKRKGANKWTAVPSNGIQLSCAQGAYIDFRYKHIEGQNVEMNAGLDQDYVRLSTNMSAEISGQLDALQLDSSTSIAHGKFHSLFYDGNNYIHASALTLPINTDDEDYSQLFEGCNNLQTAPDCSNWTETSTIGNRAFAFMFKNCHNLRAGLAMAPTSYMGNETCKEMYHNCYAMTWPGTICIKAMGTVTNNAQFHQMFAGCTNITYVTGISFEAGYASKSCCEQMFSGCSKLTGTVPLPMSHINDECYRAMYADCVKLSSVNHNYLSAASEMDDECYAYMFSGCTALQQGSVQLFGHITNDADGCFTHMYEGCSNINTLASIDFGGITGTLHREAFDSMFKGCSSLNPPSIVLPQVTEAANDYIFAYMFEGCTSLANPPKLPYTKIGASCYKAMFKDCSSITTAPDLNIKLSTNLAQECYNSMFDGCSNLTYIKCLAEDWFEIPTNNSIFTNWVYSVAINGLYKCNGSIANDSTKLQFNKNHIPFDPSNHWAVEEFIEAEPFARYRDQSTNLKNQWSGTTVYDSTNNQITDFGFFVDNSLNHTPVTRAVNDIIVMHLSQTGSGGSVPYPWANPEYYQVVTAAGTTHSSIPNISMDNTNHCFNFNQNLSEGIYPANNVSGLYEPIELSCSYDDGNGVTSTKLIKFVFVCDEESPADINANVLLLGGTGAGNITLDGIPTTADSYVMIKKFSKSTGLGTTNWCDVTGYKKLVIPVAANEWLGVKNGALDLRIRQGSGDNCYVNDGQSTGRGTLHITTSRSGGGIISGNIRGLGSPYFKCNHLVDWYSDPSQTPVYVNMWGDQCCKGMFSGSTFQIVSQDLFADCNWWKAPSGCYQMFKNCWYLNSTPEIPGNAAQGVWDEYMFYQMFYGACDSTTIARTITNVDTVYGEHAAQKMFANSDIQGFDFDGQINGLDYSFFEMFKGCSNLLGDYTYTFDLHTAGYMGCAGMFSGCTALVSFGGDFAWGDPLGTTYDSMCDGTFSAAFKDCTSLNDFTFFNSTPSNTSIFRAQPHQFESMFENDTNLYEVHGFYLKQSGVNACQNMFKGCTRLAIADVNITTDNVGSFAFQNMFSGCTALPRISYLNVTNTNESCCEGMFRGCTTFSNNNNKINLTHNTSLRCYYAMFADCANLFVSPNVIETSPVSSYNQGGNRAKAFSYMFSGCGSLLDFNLKDMVYWYNSTQLYYPTYDYMFAGCSSLNFSFGSVYYGDSDGLQYGDVDDLPVVNCAGQDKTVEGMFSGCTSLQYTPIMICPSNYGRYYDCFTNTFYDCYGLTAGAAIFIFSPKEISKMSESNFTGPFGDGTWVHCYDKNIKIVTNVNTTQYSFITATGDANCAWTQIWAYDTAWDYIINWSNIGQNYP